MASPGFGVELEGLNGAIRGLRSLGVEAADLKSVFSAVATESRDVMAGFVDSRSGALARSLRGNRATNKAIVRGGGARVPYAGAVQWGWGAGASASAIRGSFAGQHFFEKTDAVMEPRAERMIVDGLEDLIDRYDLN
ncbi:MAG TPA: hypothetical protein VIP28_01930 [Nocardioides sp.]